MYFLPALEFNHVFNKRSNYLGLHHTVHFELILKISILLSYASPLRMDILTLRYFLLSHLRVFFKGLLRLLPQMKIILQYQYDCKNMILY